MQDSDRKAFSTLLGDALGFYGQTVTKFTLDVWWQACARFDIEQVSKALTAHAMDPEHGRFAPKPADIVRELLGTHADRSLVAWGKVLEAMQRVGAYESVVFDDPAIHAAVEDVGGWVKLCRDPLTELAHTQRRFCESYKVHAKASALVYPPKLIGANEAANRLQGQWLQPPVMVGNPERARQVLLGGENRPRTSMLQALDFTGAVAKALPAPGKAPA